MRSLTRLALPYIAYPLFGFVAAMLLLRAGVPVQGALILLGAYLVADWAVSHTVRHRRRRQQRT